MELEIISPAGILFKGETDYVSFPGIAGSFDVLRPYDSRAGRRCHPVSDKRKGNTTGNKDTKRIR